MPSPNLTKDNFLNLIQGSYDEKAFRGIYDGSGNLIYAGFAQIGADPANAVWQIKKLTYTGSNLTSILWPQISGKASGDFSFIMNSYAGYTYS